MSAPAAAAPSGVVTFLFTDVEGSTRRWESDAQAMRAALVVHDKVLRTAIEAHGGWLFKHTGDGVCAVFASPKSAVDAAVAAQRELELPVRMGIGTGEAELRGADYFGAVLNRVGRVMAAGHGGQVLLADSTAGLLSGVDLVDLGPRRLRDLPTPVGVFQVRAAGLRTEFPALRALDASPGNLRAATNSLIGRESEVAELQAAVKAHRLVTLTGVGGVGKTRLALEIAGRLAVHIGGFLYLSNAKLRNADGAALSLNGSKITCVVFARGLEADGAVQAIGVHIGGQLNLSEAKLRNADGTALTLGDAEITGGVFAGGLEANGAVDANGVHIGGYLYLSEAKLRNAHGNALSLDRAEVAGGVFAGGPE